MSTRMKIAIAALLALVVFFVLVAPSVDLPATVLDAVAYVFLLLFLLRVCLVADVRVVHRPVPAACSNGPPQPLTAFHPSSPLSLRC
ncbi:MAG TPA: hypothetical protein VFU76_06140 [Terriglobales bacterium]|nr:hypothetical protein [Terriglobales bacterium]